MGNFIKALTDIWWVVALRGVVAVGFGLLALIWPDITLLTMLILFGAFSLVDGISNLIYAFDARSEGRSPWYFVLQGLLGIAAGFVIVAWPGISALTLLYLIAAWAIVTGFFELFAAIQLRRVIDNEWMLAIAGAGSIAFGVLTMIFPGSGAVSLAWLIGIYAIAFGAAMIVLGWRLRGLR